MAFDYHEGERAVQRRAGGLEAAAWGAENAIHRALPPVAAGFLSEQVLVVAGHRAADGAVWASGLGGAAGFVTAPDERTVHIAARPAGGDALTESLDAGPVALGVLAIEPGTKRRMRVNGQARLQGDGIVLRTEQVYANCPKYISVRRPEPLPVAAPQAAGPERSSELTGAQRRFVEGADTFFVASSHEHTGADASHRGGNPGFVHVFGPRRLSWPDYRGNSMFMTLGNLELDSRAGLLFADYATGGLLQLSGRARTDWDPARAATYPGAERVVDFDIDRVVWLPAATGWRWAFEKHSRVSPPAPVFSAPTLEP